MTRYKYSRKQIDKALSKWYLDVDNSLPFFEIKGMIMETVPDKPFKWSEIPRPYINRKVEPIKPRPIRKQVIVTDRGVLMSPSAISTVNKLNEVIDALNELRRAK